MEFNDIKMDFLTNVHFLWFSFSLSNFRPKIIQKNKNITRKRQIGYKLLYLEKKKCRK